MNLRTGFSIAALLFILPFLAHSQYIGSQREEFTITGLSTAKQTWWYFNHRLTDKLESQRFFRVYIIQLDAWLKDIHNTGANNYTGKIDRELSGSVGIDSFQFKSEEIADWVIVEDDILYGGFWLRLQDNQYKIKFKEIGKCKIESRAVPDDFIDQSINNVPKEFMPDSSESPEEVEAALKNRYPGGENLLWAHVMDNLSYPAYAKTFAMEGKVFTQFIIQADGSISDVKILRSIGGGTAEHARYIIKTIPPMLPSKEGYSIRYFLPIVFKLDP